MSDRKTVNEEYWVSWFEDRERTRIVTPEGPFKSIRAAEKYIREDAEDTYRFGNNDGAGRDEDWGDEHLILKTVKRVRPVPVVSLRIELKTVGTKDQTNA